MTLRRPHPLPRPLLLLLLLSLAGCAGDGPERLEMMPVPAVAAAGDHPFDDGEDPVEGGGTAQLDMLYVTNRAPATPGDPDRFYGGERGYLLRAGEASIAFGDSDITWEMAREISLLKNRPGRFPLEVRAVQPHGVIPDSVSAFTPRSQLRNFDPAGGERFAAAIEARLARTSLKEIFVYVHGFKVDFENPVLVAAEMWHFAGFEGAFVAFSWPSSEALLGYFGDSETARLSGWGLRKLIDYLARETSAERINIIGYSAGTRVVLNALHELALVHQRSSAETIRAETRLGRVLLIGSDVDTGTFASFILDGLLAIPERLDVYVSPEDGALRMSKRLLRHRRLGEVKPGTLDERMREFLAATDRLAIIDVEDAPDFDAGRGHSYFRKSPWVSSDVLITVTHGLAPEERGLVRRDGSPIWRFPADYEQRFRAAFFRTAEARAEAP